MTKEGNNKADLTEQKEVEDDDDTPEGREMDRQLNHLAEEVCT